MRVIQLHFIDYNHIVFQQPESITIICIILGAVRAQCYNKL